MGRGGGFLILMGLVRCSGSDEEIRFATEPRHAEDQRIRLP